MSGRTVEKIAAVVAAAEREPEKYSKFVDQMDETGKVDLFRQIKKAEKRQAYEARAERGGKVEDLHELVASGKRLR